MGLAFGLKEARRVVNWGVFMLRNSLSVQIPARAALGLPLAWLWPKNTVFCGCINQESNPSVL